MRKKSTKKPFMYRPSYILSERKDTENIYKKNKQTPKAYEVLFYVIENRIMIKMTPCMLRYLN